MARYFANNSQQYIIRPQARKRTPFPVEEIRIKTPKNLPQLPEKPGLVSVLPMLAFPLMTGLVGFVSAQLIGGDSVILRVCLTGLPMIMVAMLTFGVQQYSYRNKVKVVQAERERISQNYQTYLHEVAKHLEELAQQQQRILNGENPVFKELLTRVLQHSPKLWERQFRDDDFLTLRLGAGTLPNPVQVHLPEIDEDDPRLIRAKEIKDNSKTIPALPIRANLVQLGSIGIRGQKPSEALYLVFTLLASLAVQHSPDDVQVFVLSHRPDANSVWSWIHWLPHTGVLQRQVRLSFHHSTDESVLLGQLSPLLRSRADKDNRISDIYSSPDPYLVVIFDEAPTLLTSRIVQMLLAHTPEQSSNKLRACAIFVNDVPTRISASVFVNGHNLEYRETWVGHAQQNVYKGEVELTTPSQMEQLARQLAPYRTEASYGATGGGIPASVRLVELLGANQPEEIDLAQQYSSTYDLERIMAFPIGLNSDLKPQWIRLREAGQGGDGSHAMLAGMTGTGKSVLLQSMVLSMALHHSPTHLNFVLADFKGGASELAKLQDLPHVVGFVTDLLPALVERFRVALESELIRRQELFDSAKERLGQPVANIRTYNKLCQDAPVPHLVLVLDEFAHGIKINERFRRTVDEIAARGRALGMHLVLSTQRAADFDQKIRPNIEVRLCLRVASAEDSKMMLNRPEAFTRLQRPGQAYIQVGDNEIFEMFQSARADTPYLPDGRVNLAQLDSFKIYRLSVDGRCYSLYEHQKQQDSNNEAKEQENSVELSEAEVLVEQIRVFSQGRYPSTRQIWLPPLPLPEKMPLATLLNQQVAYLLWHGEGWKQTSSPTHPRLQLPLGLMDRPARQDQVPFVVDLYARDGHLMLIGPSGSGKHLVLRSLLYSLAHTHSPSAVHLYILGKSQELSIYEELPHCGAFIRVTEVERMTRLFRFLRQEVDERQQMMRQTGVDNIVTLREARPEQIIPSVIVVIEDLASLKGEYDDKLEKLQHLVGHARSVDVHLVIGANSHLIYPKLQNELQNRLAMGLKSPGDYREVLGKAAEVLPEIVGRGYWVDEQDIFEVQVAAPISESNIIWYGRAATEAIKAAVQRMNEVWDGLRPRPIEELSRQIDLVSLWQKFPAEASPINEYITAPIGQYYDSLAPITIDLARWENVSLVVGPSREGKTEFLVTLALATAKTMTPEQINIVFIGLKDRRLRPLSSLPQLTFLDDLLKAKNHLMALRDRLKEGNKHLNEPQEVSQTSDLSQVFPQRTLLLIDNLQTFLRSDNQFANLVKECLEAGHETGINLVMVDTGPNLNQAKSFQPVLLASQLGSGFVLSGDQNDLNLLQLGYKIKPPQIQLHTPIGKGRGFLSWQGEHAVQIACVEPEEADRGKALGRVIAQILQQDEDPRESEVVTPVVTTDV